MTDHQPLPVEGYRPQSEVSVAEVNFNKLLEEEVLRRLDAIAKISGIDPRWLAIGRTHIEQAFMAVNRSIFQPGRINLPSDYNHGQ